MSVMTAPAFAVLADLLKTRSGLIVGPDKMYLLESRLEPILRREKLADLTALAERLRQRPEHLAQEVVEAMATHESLFFRDGKPFDHLRQEVLPAMVRARLPGQRLRIWSAASSFGQEAYSLAMLMAEPAFADTPAEIVGTDISRDVVARAKDGRFSQFEVQRGLPITMLAKHFTRDGDQWRISEALRARTEFRVFNLLSDLTILGRFDVVFCRNVLIYFDPATKAKVLDAIARQMAPDGVLYLGAAETVLGLTDRLEPYGAERTGYRPVRPVQAAA